MAEVSSHSVLHGLLPYGDFMMVVQAIERAIYRSAREYPMRESMKATELKRRLGWCVEMATELLREHHWSGERVADTIGDALCAYLRDGAWEPPVGRRSWFGR